LAVLTIDPAAGAESGAANLARLWPFWLASGAGWAVLTAMAVKLQRRPDAGGGRVAALVVLGVATAARLLVLATHDPALSDDVYRYAFDGRNLVGGRSPYLVQPASRVDATDTRWPGESALADRMNNPELHTIYLPTSQWTFAATTLTVRPRATPDGEARLMRASMTLFEVVAIGCLLWLLAYNGRSPWWATLYAWHPLPITEIAGSGHQESIGVAFLAVALVAWSLWPKRVAPWTAALAVASLVKPVVIPVAALMLMGRRWTAWLSSLVVGAVVCVVVGAPLLLSDGGAPLSHLRDTAERFTLKWAHFGSVYEPLLTVIEGMTPAWANDPQEQLARLLCTALVGGVIVVVLVRRSSLWLGGQAIFLAMVLLSPTAHPWYLLWALFLTPMAMTRSVWIASLTLPWGYVAWAFGIDAHGNRGWVVSPWVYFIAYVPVYAALALDLTSRRHSTTVERCSSPM
jgi:hypothetical protein